MTLYSISDVARLTSIKESRLHYAHRSGQLADPTYFVAGKRIYTDSDVRRVAEFFGVDIKSTQNLEMREGEQCNLSNTLR